MRRHAVSIIFAVIALSLYGIGIHMQHKAQAELIEVSCK
jgi:hypothetical protein